MANNHKIKVIDKKLGRQKAVGQAYTDARVIEVLSLFPDEALYKLKKILDKAGK